MLTGVAIMIPTVLAGLRGLPFGWEFVVVIILLTLLFYIRVRPKERVLAEDTVWVADRTPCQPRARTRRTTDIQRFQTTTEPAVSRKAE